MLVIDEGAVAALVEAGTGVPDEEIRRRSALARADDLATVIYTSGTTGRPKGVELTHGNFVAITRNGVAGLGEVVAMPHSRTLLFMPLAHVFARFIQVLCVPSGAVLGHTPDAKNLLADLGDVPADVHPGRAPRLREGLQLGGAEGRLGDQAASCSAGPPRPPRTTPARWRPAARAPPCVPGTRSPDGWCTRSSARRWAGAPSSRSPAAHPWASGSGTSTAASASRCSRGTASPRPPPPTAVTRPGVTTIGTVGPAYPGTAMRVDDEGQIFVSGPHVFRGYRHDPEATAEALVDGWFRTGDLGTLDDDGCLRITGRTKEIIVTAGGKNVAPAVLEDRLRGHPLVSQVVVVGDQRPFIGALVTLDADMLPGWLSNHGLPAMSVDEAATDPAVLEALDRAADRANEAVSRAESIRKLRVLTTDFTEANGYLTPSMKVKRALVLKDFAADIDTLYTDTRGD